MVEATAPAGRADGEAKSQALAPAAVAPPLHVKLAYGFGAVAYGVKENGFSYFLMLFYSQVVGLDARLVGLAMTISLVFDAISDPILGYWSDNLRSRWGRRHPFMYASAIPVAATYYLLWNPPEGLSQWGLFGYLLALAVFIRISVTLFEIPNSALSAELSTDYDQRSSLSSWRLFFAWAGGNAMTVLMFMFLFPAFVTPAIADGRFNPDAYSLYGLVACGWMLTAILVCAFGTHSQIKHLPPPPPKRQLTLGKVFKEIFETLADRSFGSLFFAALLGAVATGLSAALAFYFSTYFWGFTTQQTGIQTFAVFGSAIIGGAITPWASRTLGKKKAAMIIGVIAFIGSPLPILLRLAGVMPPNGTPELFWIIVVAGMIDVALIISFQALVASMLADLVEQAQVRTGRRSEGLFFSAYAFIRKSVQGLGIIVAGFVLAAAGLGAGADPSEVGHETLNRLGAYYAPTILAIWMVMMAIISTYKIDRASHEENLRRLKAQEGQGEA